VGRNVGCPGPIECRKFRNNQIFCSEIHHSEFLPRSSEDPSQLTEEEHNDPIEPVDDGNDNVDEVIPTITLEQEMNARYGA
jgi:hypothetical protein